ncbi:MAG: DUF58 domain-containing protein [Caldilineaceae bacterium]
MQVISALRQKLTFVPARRGLARGQPADASPRRSWWDITPLWNQGLPPEVRITHYILWPLLLTPLLLLNQLVTPHPVWVVLIVVLVGLYGVALVWVRSQALAVTLTRRRTGSLLVAGDELVEDFELRNESALPVLWAEFLDHSNLPGYQPGRVVGCGGNTSVRWKTAATCRQRGVYQLGPHQLILVDPFHLFTLTIDYPETETVIIYPRVLHLPAVTLPLGSTTGSARRQRPLRGALPAATVRDYQATDSLRYVHWPLTAHRGELMVKELESEPSGAVWIVLDLNRAVHRGEGEEGTLEYSIVVAASIAAALVTSSERRAVGLFTISGKSQEQALDEQATTDPAQPVTDHEVIIRPPQTGQSHLWSILAELAPVQASAVTLAELLHTARTTIGRRATVMVVTAQPTELALDEEWPAELIHLHATGVASAVSLVTLDGIMDKDDEQLHALLARYSIPVQYFVTTAQLPSALTFRRTRKVIRSTPTGGVVTYDEEVEIS